MAVDMNPSSGMRLHLGMRLRLYMRMGLRLDMSPAVRKSSLSLNRKLSLGKMLCLKLGLLNLKLSLSRRRSKLTLSLLHRILLFRLHFRKLTLRD
jgi:hypothetical protein